MATNFPGSLDSFTNPTSGSTLDSPSHASQHANINDAVEALEAKVGVDGSAVTTSLDYKVAQQGLTLLARSAATSGTVLSFDNVFSSTFNVYRIAIVVNVTSAFGLQMRMRSGGSDSTGANYRYVRTAYTYGGTLEQSYSAGDTKWNIPCIASTNNAGGVLDVYNPYSANKTTYSGSGSDGRVGSGTGGLVGGGILNTNASHDGFSLISSTINSLIVSVYGYNNG